MTSVNFCSFETISIADNRDIDAFAASSSSIKIRADITHHSLKNQETVELFELQREAEFFRPKFIGAYYSQVSVLYIKMDIIWFPWKFVYIIVEIIDKEIIQNIGCHDYFVCTCIYRLC